MSTKYSYSAFKITRYTFYLAVIFSYWSKPRNEPFHWESFQREMCETKILSLDITAVSPLIYRRICSGVFYEKLSKNIQKH